MSVLPKKQQQQKHKTKNKINPPKTPSQDTDKNYNKHSPMPLRRVCISSLVFQLVPKWKSQGINQQPTILQRVSLLLTN